MRDINPITDPISGEVTGYTVIDKKNNKVQQLDVTGKPVPTPGAQETSNLRQQVRENGVTFKLDRVEGNQAIYIDENGNPMAVGIDKVRKNSG